MKLNHVNQYPYGIMHCKYCCNIAHAIGFVCMYICVVVYKFVFLLSNNIPKQIPSYCLPPCYVRWVTWFLAWGKSLEKANLTLIGLGFSSCNKTLNLAPTPYSFVCIQKFSGNMSRQPFFDYFWVKASAEHIYATRCLRIQRKAYFVD